MDYAKEKESLAQIDFNIAQAERLIPIHENRMLQMQEQGQEIAQAGELLHLMHQYLALARTQRSLILARLGRHE